MKNYGKKLVGIFVILILAGGLLGCSSNTPSDRLEGYLEGIKNGDHSEFSTVLSKGLGEGEIGEDILEEDIESYAAFGKYMEGMENITYTINSETIDGDNATVNVTLNGPDLRPVLQDYIQEVFSFALVTTFSGMEYTEEELNEKYDELLLESMDKMKDTERTEDIVLTKVDDKWEITEDDGLIKLLTNIDESMFEDFEDMEMGE